MIIVIRISGLVEVDHTVNETLSRLRLRRKYTAILLQETAENLKLLQHIRNFVAYGQLDQTTLAELLTKRGNALNHKKVDGAKLAPEAEKKTLDELGLKPFFCLHPPRGGIDSKLHYPKGVLGDNKKDIAQLVRRML